MFSTDRTALREVFFRAWRNHREQRALEGIEATIVDVAVRHPEYHQLLDGGDTPAQRDYHAALGETNPFMHMGLHIAVAEQLSINQPPGVRELFQRLAARLIDPHAAEHAMMECLTETLWQAQQAGRPLDQNAYLDCLGRLAPQP